MWIWGAFTVALVACWAPYLCDCSVVDPLLRKASTKNVGLLVMRDVQCDNQHLALRCPKGLSVFIVEAFYGRKVPGEKLCPYDSPSLVPSAVQPTSHPSYNCSTGTKAENFLIQKCRGRDRCGVKVSPETFGETACPDIPKYLDVSYQCVNQTIHFYHGCKGKKHLNLYCDPSKRVAVVRAKFGWDSDMPSNCVTSSLTKPPAIPQVCHARDVLREVVAACVNRRYCIIPLKRLTTEECDSVAQYADVAFICEKPPRSAGTAADAPQEKGVPWRMAASFVDGTPPPLPTRDPNPIAKPNGAAGYNNTLAPRSADPNALTNENTTCNYSLHHDHSVANNGILISWVFTANYISENQEKMVLYVCLSASLGLILAMCVLMVRLAYRRGRARQPSAHSFLSSHHHKLNVPGSGLDGALGASVNIDHSNEENTYVPAGDPSDVDVLQYNLGTGSGRGMTLGTLYTHRPNIRTSYYENEERSGEDAHSLFGRESDVG